MGVKDFSTEQAFKNRDLPTRGEDFSDDTETVIFNLRLHKRRKAALQKAFKLKGLDLSTGIRMVVYEWLERQK